MYRIFFLYLLSDICLVVNPNVAFRHERPICRLGGGGGGGVVSSHEKVRSVIIGNFHSFTTESLF